MSHCTFCRIAAGTLPARPVYADEEILAFHDVHPQAPLHILVIPRRHLPSLAQARGEDAALLGRVLLVAARVAAEAGAASGFRVVTNTGPEAGQSVDHLHLHVLGGRPFGWPPG